MGPFDLVTKPLRALLGEAERAEHEATAHSPLPNTQQLEQRLGEAISAAHRTAESVERHVQVIESLADTLPPLTQSVTQLSDQIGHLLRVTAPLSAAERDISKVEGLLHRRHHDPQAPGPNVVPEAGPLGASAEPGPAPPAGPEPPGSEPPAAPPPP
ncbi:MAG: hypothetical protein JOZ73_09950 [Solirubrobacterales bacterium]|nr:hypothetical protein [Solirubrobacterales bacterium]